MKVKAIGLRGRIEFHFSELDNEVFRMARIEVDILKAVGFCASRLQETEEGKTRILYRGGPRQFNADNIAAIQEILSGYCLDIEWEKSARKALHYPR